MTTLLRNLSNILLCSFEEAVYASDSWGGRNVSRFYILVETVVNIPTFLGISGSNEKQHGEETTYYVGFGYKEPQF